MALGNDVLLVSCFAQIAIVSGDYGNLRAAGLLARDGDLYEEGVHYSVSDFPRLGCRRDLDDDAGELSACYVRQLRQAKVEVAA